MIRTYVLPIVSLLAIAIFTQCRKTTTDNNPLPNKYDVYYYPDSELSAHFRYQKGSYWIYKDTLSGRIDSFYVTSSDTSEQVSVVHNLGISDFMHTVSYNIRIQQENINGVSGATASAWLLVLSNNDGRLRHADNGQQLNTVLTFHHPLNIATGYSADSMIIMNTYNDYNIRGSFYNNVVEMNHLTASENDDYFISEDDGIVMMNIYHPHSGIHQKWELVRSNIIR